MADETVFRFVLEDDGQSPESINRAEQTRALQNTRSDEDTTPIQRVDKTGKEAAEESESTVVSKKQAEEATADKEEVKAKSEAAEQSEQVQRRDKTGREAAEQSEQADAPAKKSPHPATEQTEAKTPKVKTGAAAAGETEAAAGLGVAGALGVAAAAITLKEAFGLLKESVHWLNENIKDTIERLKNLSPELAAAQGNAEVMRVLADLESASRNGRAFADLLESRTKLETELGKIKNDVLGVFAEKLTPIVELMANLADVAEDNKEGIKTLLNAILLPLTALSKIAEVFNRNFEKKEDQIPARDIFGMFLNAPNLQVGPAAAQAPVVPNQNQPQPALPVP